MSISRYSKIYELRGFPRHLPFNCVLNSSISSIMRIFRHRSITSSSTESADSLLSTLVALESSTLLLPQRDKFNWGSRSYGRYPWMSPDTQGCSCGVDESEIVAGN